MENTAVADPPAQQEDVPEGLSIVTEENLTRRIITFPAEQHKAVRDWAFNNGWDIVRMGPYGNGTAETSSDEQLEEEQSWVLEKRISL